MLPLSRTHPQSSLPSQLTLHRLNGVLSVLANLLCICRTVSIDHNLFHTMVVPNVDGYVLMCDPLAAMSATGSECGDLPENVPVIVGASQFEGYLFAGELLPIFGPMVEVWCCAPLCDDACAYPNRCCRYGSCAAAPHRPRQQTPSHSLLPAFALPVPSFALPSPSLCLLVLILAWQAGAGGDVWVDLAVDRRGLRILRRHLGFGAGDDRRERYGLSPGDTGWVVPKFAPLAGSS